MRSIDCSCCCSASNYSTHLPIRHVEACTMWQVGRHGHPITRGEQAMEGLQQVDAYGSHTATKQFQETKRRPSAGFRAGTDRTIVMLKHVRVFDRSERRAAVGCNTVEVGAVAHRVGTLVGVQTWSSGHTGKLTERAKRRCTNDYVTRAGWRATQLLDLHAMITISNATSSFTPLSIHSSARWLGDEKILDSPPRRVIYNCPAGCCIILTRPGKSALRKVTIGISGLHSLIS